MQTNFETISFRGFSKKFWSEQYFGDISAYFRETYCFELRENLNDDLLCTISCHKLSSDNSLETFERLFGLLTFAFTAKYAVRAL